MRRLLMCPPHYYNVVHHMQNVHMKMSREVMPNKAQKQWVNLYNLLTYNLGAQVVLTPPAIGMVDMVFSANTALIKGNKAMIANFSAPARKLETEYYKKILDKLDFDTKIPNFEFEGQGDALFSHQGDELWIGYGYRTLESSHQEVGDFLNVKNINSMMLVDPRFYHIDTCFCPLDDGRVMFYPGAFTQNDVDLITDKFGEDNCITVSEEDADNFACNAISLDNNIVLNKASRELKLKLRMLGYNLYENDMSEFLLSGGSTKCSILHLN